MTHEELDALIDQLNGRADGSIFVSRALTNDVVVAQVWLPDRHEHVQTSPDRYFFVKAPGDDAFVGAIQDRGSSDLHVYVKPDHRGRGLLLDALDAVVFPWLTQIDNRQEQNLTFQETRVKRYFARRLGFRSTGPLTSRKSLRIYRSRAVAFLPAPKLTTEAFRLMKLRLDRACQLVEVVREHVVAHGLGAAGSKTTADLSGALDRLGRLDDRIRFDAHDAQGGWV